MSTLLTSIGSVFTAAIGWVGDVVEVITASGNELLLIFCIIPLVGLGVGLTKRLMNMNQYVLLSVISLVVFRKE